MSENKSLEIEKERTKKASLDSTISDFNNAIVDDARAYETLVQFKKNVSKTQEDINGITKHQSKYLSQVDDLSKVSNCAKEYACGMRNTLSGFGSNIVGLALSGLLLKIDVKLLSYKKEIEIKRNMVNSLQKELEKCDERINKISSTD